MSEEMSRQFCNFRKRKNRKIEVKKNLPTWRTQFDIDGTQFFQVHSNI